MTVNKKLFSNRFFFNVIELVSQSGDFILLHLSPRPFSALDTHAAHHQYGQLFNIRLVTVGVKP